MNRDMIALKQTKNIQKVKSKRLHNEAIGSYSLMNSSKKVSQKKLSIYNAESLKREEQSKLMEARINKLQSLLREEKK